MSKSIVVHHLSKQYRINQLQGGTTFREALVDLLRSPFRKARVSQTLWALNDVSFSVDEGEILGIIGRNGAGKSTLLKILSRVTRPTSGSMEVKGRVAAMLEVGTGFHDELTGRENIYLAGSILGMRKKRIDAKLDAIVDFSGVGKLIDTPIKRYSSGMKLRLGFAVSANLEADILCVDEVLAVGDGEFQKKCLKAMGDLHGSGRTVLFVSHNLAAIENLCSRAIWVDGGQIRQDGSPQEVIEAYMSTFVGTDQEGNDLSQLTSRRGSGELRFTKIEFMDVHRRKVGMIRSGDGLMMRLHYEARKPLDSPVFGVEIHSQLGTLISQVHTYNNGFDVAHVPVGSGFIDLSIAELNLRPGRYNISLFATNLGYVFYDVLQHCASLDVESSNRYGLNRAITGSPLISLACRWEVGDRVEPPGGDIQTEAIRNG